MLTIRGALGRESLRLGVLSLPDSRDRLGWLLTHLADLPGSGIIYTLTVSAAEDTARLLAEAGHEVLAYTGRTDPADRERAEQLLKDNQVKALVATSALGMGFDKPDLGFVVHLGAPSSPVAYYQQVGRAGRGAANADVLLLPGSEDRDIWQYFATASMPSEEKAAAVLTALAEAGNRRVHGGARGPRGPAPDAAGTAAEGPGRGRGRGTRRRRLALHRPALDLRRRAVQPDRRGPGGRAGLHGHLPGHRRLPDGVHHLGPRRRDSALLRALRQLRRAVVPGGHCRLGHGGRGPDPEPRRRRRWSRGCSGPAAWTASAWA